MALELYNQKRDFTKTAEPPGKLAKADSHRFVIQKHDATRLHYDFRLEWGGVLKSWAVTRGPSPNPHDKRLAVETEDHPLEYANFEGTIPQGEYGGGTVMLWDEGTWQPDSDPEKAYRKGHLRFTMHGQRMHGSWHLVRMQPRKNEKRTNWLLIKDEDEFAIDGDGEAWLAQYDSSIRTKRDLKAIAQHSASWPEVKRKADKAKAVKPPKDAPKTAMPGFIPPELATLRSEPPVGEAWVHEIKLDGYRIQAHIRDGAWTLYSRNGLDWTSRFPTIAYGLELIQAREAILDGEIIVPNARGTSDFMALQRYLKGEEKTPPVYYLFDLLYLEGRDLRPLPLVDRKRLLKELLAPVPGDSGIRFSEHLEGKGHTIYSKACSMALEGIISKRGDGAYVSGRVGDWVKSKCEKRQELVIGGYNLPTKGTRGIRSLLIGYYDDAGKLIYAGKVGTGFTSDESVALRKRLEGMERKTMPFEAVPAAFRRGARWVKPELVAEIQFTEWTTDGRLRHPSFQGLREDKPATGVVRESEGDTPSPKDAPGENKPAEKAPSKNPPEPVKTKTPRGKKQVIHIEDEKPKPAGKSALVGGVRISSPGKVLFPEAGITKQAVAEYYNLVADHILPHITGRALSLLRCPDGQRKGCFFQRHHGSGLPEAVGKVIVEQGEPPYLSIDNKEGLLSLVQMGTLEIHPWGAPAGDLDNPDRIIFDLDPSEDVPWSWVQEAAAELFSRLDQLGLVSYLKASGGKGLHVVVPLTGTHTWDQVKTFTRNMAQEMERARPNRYLIKMTKALRQGKIFVDYLRNEKTATAIAPYSLRAREGAPIAVPLAWKELFTLTSGHPFTLQNIRERLEKPDPWVGMHTVKQSLPELQPAQKRAER